MLGTSNSDVGLMNKITYKQTPGTERIHNKENLPWKAAHPTSAAKHHQRLSKSSCSPLLYLSSDHHVWNRWQSFSHYEKSVRNSVEGTNSQRSASRWEQPSHFEPAGNCTLSLVLENKVLVTLPFAWWAISCHFWKASESTLAAEGRWENKAGNSNASSRTRFQ